MDTHMMMEPTNFLVHIAIAIAAVVYGVLSGRAKAARLRTLHQDISKGNPRGYLILFVVFAMVTTTFALQT